MNPIIETKRFVLVNQSLFKSKDLIEITSALLEGQSAPFFYLIVNTPKHNGVTLTNLDKPTMIIIPNDLGDFAKIFVHELMHLQQHSKGYADEDEAYHRELVVTQ